MQTSRLLSLLGRTASQLHKNPQFLRMMPVSKTAEGAVTATCNMTEVQNNGERVHELLRARRPSSEAGK